MGRDIVCLASYSAIQVNKNLGHRVCQKVVVYGMPFTKIAVFTCDIKQEPSDKKSFHKSNNGKTTPLVQAYFLDIRKKTQGVKNSKLKRKTQNSS